MKTYSILAAVFAVLAVLSAVYIFYNGMQNGEESNVRSDEITEKVVIPMLPKDEKGEPKKLPFTLSAAVRKTAHLFEYFLFGLLSALSVAFFRLSGKKLSFFSASTAACVIGVADEYFQSFAGRTSLVKDIFYDIGGGVLGMALAIAVYLIIKNKRKNS